MNSANGTYVNGKRIGEHYLNDGDEVLIGKHTLKYNAHGTVEPATAPAQAGGAGDDLQDALHTYVMDGARIRERLAEMGGPGGEGEAAPAKPPGTSRFAAAPEGAPKTAKDHANDFDPLKPQRRPTSAPRPAPSGGAGGLKAMLYFSLATNLVLIVLIVLMIVFLMKMTRQQGNGAAPGAPQNTPAESSGGASTP
jgi:hypothetical protein